MTAVCHGCGRTWPRDPRLEVECPTCHARVGNECRFEAPSGHKRSASFAGKQPHVEREELAMARGFLERCPVEPPPARPAPAQALLPF